MPDSAFPSPSSQKAAPEDAPSPAAQEIRDRGSFLFPFEQYSTDDKDGSFYVSPHWHQEVEILCILRGCVRMVIDSHVFFPGAGSVLFVNPKEIHHLTSQGPGLLYHAYVFPLQLLSFSHEDYCQQAWILPLLQGRSAFPRLLKPDHPCQPEATEILIRLSQIRQGEQAGYQLMVKALLYQLLGCLIHKDALMSAPPAPTAAQAIKMESLRQMLSYMEEHLQERLTLDEISARFYMTPNYFCRFFKDNLGKTPMSCLNGLRLEKACRLLADTDMQILEICLCCGFNNLSYFVRLFHRQMGMSPSRYRAEAARQRNTCEYR